MRYIIISGGHIDDAFALNYLKENVYDIYAFYDVEGLKFDKKIKCGNDFVAVTVISSVDVLLPEAS